MHVDRLRRAEPGRIPDFTDECLAAYDLARMFEQDAQQRELLHREVDLLASAGNTVGFEVHGDIADLEH